MYPQWAPIMVPPELNGRVLERTLDWLVGINEDWLRANPRTPLLRQSGVRYVPETTQELFLSIPWCLTQLQNPSLPVDCEDLCAWRVAELRVKWKERGARCIWTRYDLPDGRVLYHVRVRRADGRIEDPSLELGMGKQSTMVAEPLQLVAGVPHWWYR